MLYKTVSKTLAFIALFLTCINVCGQLNPVRLKGTVTGLKLPRESQIKFSVFETHFIYAHSLPELVTVPINPDGSFEVTLPAPANLFYVRLAIDTNGRYASNFRARAGGAQQAYLLEAGDSLFMKIDVKNVLLNCFGKGAEKLNCQNQLYNTSYQPVGAFERVATLNATNIMAAFELKREIRRSILDLQFTILNSYRSFLSNEVYTRIYQDCLGFSRHNEIDGLQSQTAVANKAMYVAAKEIFYKYYPLKDTLLTKSPTIHRSAYYLDYLYEQERAQFVFGGKIDSRNYSYTFKEMYEILKKKYTGAVRDKLLIMCFYRFGSVVQEEAKPFIADARKVVKTPEYSELLERWNSNITNPYHFNLPDKDGRKWSLNDFKGKTILIDFWFKGCHSCVLLKQKLEPMIKQYGSHPEVVFLTINIDKVKSTWLSGLETGKYSAPENINLFTEGLGFDHPIIKHFGFTGAPQLVVIGKDGRVISADKVSLMDNDAARLKKILAQRH